MADIFCIAQIIASDFYDKIDSMKGVILAGGLGTRLYPLTHVTNKHLLPIFDRPMVYYPIQTLVNSGIKEIMVVVGGPHAGHFMKVLKNGEEFGLEKLIYAYQEGEGGIAAALALAEKFADGDSVCVILGDNTTDTNLKKYVDKFRTGACIFIKKVDKPQKFGVPVFKGKKIVAVEEKPKNPKSNYAVTGLYMFDNKCFDFITHLKPSGRGELEVTDIINKYIAAENLTYNLLTGYWKDAGSFESMLDASNYWSKKGKK